MAQTTRRIHRIDSLYPGSDKFYTPYIGKGEVIFTGPDAIKNHKVTILQPTYVGIGTMSREGTSSAEYLWRPGRRWAFHPPKSARVGEIGWGLNLINDTRRLKSGHQMKIGYGTFRQVLEDRHTHLYQNPWYPDMRYENQDTDDAGYQEPAACSRERCYTPFKERTIPGNFRSHTPSPRSVHYNDSQFTRRSKSCTPPGSGQRARSGTLSSSTTVQSQIYAL